MTPAESGIGKQRANSVSYTLDQSCIFCFCNSSFLLSLTWKPNDFPSVIIVILFTYPAKLPKNIGKDETIIKPASRIMNFELLFINYYMRPTLIR